MRTAPISEEVGGEGRACAPSPPDPKTSPIFPHDSRPRRAGTTTTGSARPAGSNQAPKELYT